MPSFQVSPRDPYMKIIAMCFGVIFTIAILTLLYKAMSGNTDMRSRASRTARNVLRSWEFHGEREGWTATTGVTLETTSNFLVVTASKPTQGSAIRTSVSVGTDKGFKYLTMRLSANSPSVSRTAKPTGISGPSGTFRHEPVVCTTDVKQCPDGSFVGRTGENCSFAPCPPKSGEAVKGESTEPEVIAFPVSVSYLNPDTGKNVTASMGLVSLSRDGQMRQVSLKVPSLSAVTILAFAFDLSGVPQGTVLKIDYVGIEQDRMAQKVTPGISGIPATPATSVSLMATPTPSPRSFPTGTPSLQSPECVLKGGKCVTIGQRCLPSTALPYGGCDAGSSCVALTAKCVDKTP